MVLVGERLWGQKFTTVEVKLKTVIMVNKKKSHYIKDTLLPALALNTGNGCQSLEAQSSNVYVIPRAVMLYNICLNTRMA